VGGNRQQQRLQRREQILTLLAAEARPLILEHWAAYSCIASTRVAIDVLGAFGIVAEARPVHAYIFNAPLWKRLEAGEQPAAGEIDRLFAIDGSWSIGLGFGGDMGANKWPGHLVALVRRPQVLVDLSLDQASRPERQIDLGPIIAPIRGPEFLRGEGQIVGEVNGTVVAYETIDEHGYTLSPDWTEKERHMRVVPEIVKRIRERLL
jgi:hypothetical protein